MQTQYNPGEGTATPQQSSAPASLLVADCGSVVTKVSLFGLVEGQYRLMARGEAATTLTPPHQDITEGIIQAIQVVEFITGRKFIENRQVITPEPPDGNGVDLFIATISAGQPLRLMVTGAVSPALEKLASQAISGLYAQIQSFPTPSYVAATTPAAVGASSPGIGGMGWTPDRTKQEWERLFSRIRDMQPDAALIVGMANDAAGPTPLQEASQLLVNSAQQYHQQHGAAKRYALVYAGAPQYVEAVRRIVQNVADITRVDPLVSPAQLRPISMAVGSLHERQVLQKLPGYDRLRSWTSAPPVASATSLSSLVRFLAQHYTMNVTAVDLGGSTTTVMMAGEQGEFVPKVNAGVGVGQGLGAVLQQVGWQRVARWLPFRITEEEIRRFVLEQMAQPYGKPTEAHELQILHAFAREAMIITIEAAKRNSGEWPNTDLILATGGLLSQAPKFGQVAMMLLDAIQPRGVTSLVLDRTMLISQLGAVATVAPIMAVQVNENDAVSHRLGTCVVPYGNMQPGQLAVRVGVEYSNGQQHNIDVMTGTIEVIPLKLNEQALLTLFPAPQVDVGLGPGERARAAEEIDGGLVGLIIDARGRPLALPQDEMERQARLMQWGQALGI